MTNFRMALLDLLRKDEQGSDPHLAEAQAILNRSRSGR
jgi:hypothetical protein